MINYKNLTEEIKLYLNTQTAVNPSAIVCDKSHNEALSSSWNILSLPSWGLGVALRGPPPKNPVVRKSKKVKIRLRKTMAHKGLLCQR
jgi:hypothetical protein